VAAARDIVPAWKFGESSMTNSRYEIITDFERPDPALVARAEPLYYCLLGGEVGPRQVMDPGIKPLDIQWRVCGPAFTVRSEYADDQLMSKIAGKYAKPGDVIVVDAIGSRLATWGASMAHGIKQAGANGLVLDGYVLTEDLLRLRENIPVFCRGTMSISSGGARPGWLNIPVICGGVIVYPGDLVVGDGDGVVVVPKARIAEVVAAVEARNQSRAREGLLAPRKPDAPLYYKKSGAEDAVTKLVNERKIRIT
jgi:4-hydroxy-4-methyl-2-oxoglutarate aldolase